MNIKINGQRDHIWKKRNNAYERNRQLLSEGLEIKSY